MDTAGVRYVNIRAENVQPGDLVTVQQEWGLSTLVAQPVEDSRDIKNGKLVKLGDNMFPSDALTFVGAVRVVPILVLPTEPGVYRVRFNEGQWETLICARESTASSPYWRFLFPDGSVGDRRYLAAELTDITALEVACILKVQDKVDA